jgi:hypothetical protein
MPRSRCSRATSPIRNARLSSRAFRFFAGRSASAELALPPRSGVQPDEVIDHRTADVGFECMRHCGILSLLAKRRGGFYRQLAPVEFPKPGLCFTLPGKRVMGTHGPRGGVRGGGPRIRFFHLYVASFGLLPMLGGCSSSPSLPGATTQPVVVGTGYGTAINPPSPPDGSGPSGLLVDLMGSKPVPRPPAAAPSQPGTYTLDGYMLAAQMPAAPPPLNNPIALTAPPSNNPTTRTPPLVSDTVYGTAINTPSPPPSPPAAAPPPPVVGTGYGTAINTASPSYGPGPSGLLVDLFGSKPAPSGTPVNP